MQPQRRTSPPRAAPAPAGRAPTGRVTGRSHSPGASARPSGSTSRRSGAVRAAGGTSRIRAQSSSGGGWIPWAAGGGAAVVLLLILLAASGGGDRARAATKKKGGGTSGQTAAASLSGRVQEARRKAESGVEIISRQEVRLRSSGRDLSDGERRAIADELNRGMEMLRTANQICQEVSDAGQADLLPSDDETRNWNDYIKQASMDLREIRD